MSVLTVEGANMLLKAPAAPNLPIAPPQYSPEFQNRNNNTLRLFANGVSEALNNLTGSNGAKYLQSPYGSWYDTTTQSAGAVNTATAVTLNSTWLENGIFKQQPGNTLIYVPVQGVYNFEFSAQLSKPSASAGYIWIWCRVAGVDVAYSNSEIVVQGTAAQTVAAWNFMLYLLPTQSFQMMWATDTNVQILAQGPSGFAPGIPSMILTANFISAVTS